MKTSCYNKRIYEKLLKLAKGRGCEVLQCEFLTSIKGVCIINKKRSVIGISTRIKGREKNFVLAHEIGHAVLHKNGLDSELYFNNKRYHSKKEDEANRFARKLLYIIDENSK